MTVILGIDPGSRFLGYGVLKTDGSQYESLDLGVVKVPSKLPLSEKLFFIETALDKVIVAYEPTEMAVENIFLGKNADSAFKLGHVRGVCLCLAAKRKMNVYEYAARAVKKKIFGSGAADKEQVRLMILRMLNIQTDAKLDATDAMAVALAHAQERDVKIKMAQQMKEL